MKKFEFAAKVFGLLAMLPIFVILEMNHNTGNFFEMNPPSGAGKIKQVNDTCSIHKTNNKTGNDVSFMHSEILLIK